jgi:ribosome-associated protein
VRREADVIPLHPVPRASRPDVEDTVRLLLDSLEEMKAEEIVEIDLRGKSSIADLMIIATGRVARHVGAIADRVVKDLKDAGNGTVRVEGMPVCDWVLIDAGDVILHIFRPEVRVFYNLEKMWSSGRPSEIRPV